MKYTKINLNNGSILGVITLPGVYAVTISAFVKAGFKYDPANKPGLAHFTEHMLFDGTKEYPSPKQLSWAIERYGGWHYAFTWVEHQMHSLQLPRDNFEHGIKVLLDMLVNPLMDEEELEREKGMVKQEILRNKSDSEKAVLDYAWQPLFFQGTTIARPYSGVEEDIDHLSKKDVQDFLKKVFLAKSTVFMVAGDVNTTKAIELFNKYIDGYTREGSVATNNIVSSSTQRVKVFPSKDEQVSIAVGIRGVDYNNLDKHVLELIKDLLGGYLGARLPQKLKEEGGLIYNWNIWQDNFLDTGYLIFKASTAIKNVYKFIEIVISEFDRLTKGVISKDELNIAKGHIVGGLFCYTQTGYDFANWFGLQELMMGKALSLDEQAKIYSKISSEEILRVAKKYFTKDNIYIAVVGDANEEEILKKL